MEGLRININYQPKAKAVEPALFNHAYMEYIKNLGNEQHEETRPVSQQSAVVSNYGLNPQSLGAKASHASSTVPSTIQDDDEEYSEQTHKARSTEEQNMINISGCEFDEFKHYMIKKYGETQFVRGFDIINKNRYVAYEPNGEQRL